MVTTISANEKKGENRLPMCRAAFSVTCSWIALLIKSFLIPFPKLSGTNYTEAPTSLQENCPSWERHFCSHPRRPDTLLTHSRKVRTSENSQMTTEQRWPLATVLRSVPHDFSQIQAPASARTLSSPHFATLIVFPAWRMRSRCGAFLPHSHYCKRAFPAHCLPDCTFFANHCSARNFWIVYSWSELVILAHPRWSCSRLDIQLPILGPY